MKAATMHARTIDSPQLDGLRVLVLGLGRSGAAAARLALAEGARVLLSDRRPGGELGSVLDPLLALGAEFVGADPAEHLWHRLDLLVVSPGIPADHPIVRTARERQLPVWGETELAGRFVEGRIFGITGSNGKSTTTSMAGAVLREAGFRGGTGGNLGTPLADLLAQDGPDAVHAVELSSFQLETVERFRPTVGALLNLSPDHQDRYACFDDYVAAKGRLLDCLDPEGFAVVNADDARCLELSERVRDRRRLFSTRRTDGVAAWVVDGRLWIDTGDVAEELMRTDQLQVVGQHNVANALAAALGCRLLGCKADAIRRGLAGFPPLRHRLQRVGRIAGIDFYNDSKATNVDAARRAVRSFDDGRVWLILGGRDKGADWDSLREDLARYCRAALLVGEAAPALERALSGATELIRAGTIATAVGTALAQAGAGDVVLLSPGCASFDQYENFEARGDDFIRTVEARQQELGDA